MTLRAGVAFFATCLVLSCALLDHLRGPPRAPAAEADQVVFSLYAPPSTVTLDGLRLRAASIALADFLPQSGGATSCYEREESYDVTVWIADGLPPDGGCPAVDAGFPQEDGGYRDVGLMSGLTCETLYGTPGLAYVEISLRPGACDDGGEIILDQGGRYAIDVRRWRIAAAQR